MKKVAIIGGGAAGFFAAISVKEHYPDAEVTLFEKSSKLLSKVLISGGGRCNVTHDCLNVSELCKHYPRGAKPLRKVFDQFSVKDTIKWFNDRKVELKIESDGRMFPTTDNSQTIANCLLSETKSLGIQIETKHAIETIESTESQKVKLDSEIYDFVIVATGGSPKLAGLDWLKTLGHEIKTPVPSLFTFNMPKENVRELMGITIPEVTVKVIGTKLEQSGPLLITHWGMSGPAILKTSAWGARELADMQYQFTIQVNWLVDQKEEVLREKFSELQTIHAKRQIKNKNPFFLPQRLWDFLLAKVEIPEAKIWVELSKKEKNRLINALINNQYQVSGKTTFKEEFVTCGGVSLTSVNMKTMESKAVPNLYFAGEVLDIDGVTGGFNFQAAWSTAFVAGQLK